MALADGPPDQKSYDYFHSSGNFGGIGLLEMPNARFRPDGDFAVGIHVDDVYERYFASWQATPWLEATLSYTDIEDPLISDLSQVTRALDIKLRLFEESDIMPSVALGFQDGLGDGRFGAEYLVASKRFYNLDFTFGFGWGYLAGRGGFRNIFRSLGDGFDARNSDNGQGGRIQWGSYFAGSDMAIFGGVEYRTPIQGLSLKAEYSSADTDQFVGPDDDDFPINVGINYRPASWADLALGFDRGDTLTFRLVLSGNLHRLSLGGKDRGLKPVPISVRDKNEPDQRPDIQNTGSQKNNRLFDRLAGLDFLVTEFRTSQQGPFVKLKYTGQGEPDHMLALGAVLENHQAGSMEIVDQKGKTHALKADRSDGIGTVALSKFRKSVIYVRELKQNNLTQSDLDLLQTETIRQLSAAGLDPTYVAISERKVLVEKKTGPYNEIPKNMGRAARVLTNTMPDNVDVFDIITTDRDFELANVTLLRRDFENAHNYRSSPEEILVGAMIKEPDNDTIPTDKASINEVRSFKWSILPDIETHFGGQESGRFRADLSVKLAAEYKVADGFYTKGEIRQLVIGDLDKIPGRQNNAIPAVRSDIGRYADEGTTAITKLQGYYFSQPLPNIYTRLSGGLLESMYGGITAEVLYRPYDKNFAIGADLNWVKQRDFDQLFSFRDYDTFTGHVALYHENTKYNITSIIRAGRYLAGDWGATFDVSRRFDNGIRLGLWTTYTDVSADDFGEGSFDKGIYVKVPFGLFWPKPSRNIQKMTIRSLNRDGGQRLVHDVELYDILSSGRQKNLLNDWKTILE